MLASSIFTSHHHSKTSIKQAMVKKKDLEKELKLENKARGISTPKLGERPQLICLKLIAALV